ncbi:phage tail tape measure protein [Mycolicibacterium sp. XJ775]
MPVSIPVGAELDERSATAAAEKARRVFAAAGQDAGKAFGAGLGQADEGLRKFEKQAKDTYDKAADAAGKLRSEEEKLQSLRDRGARNDQIVSQAERVEKARRAEVRAVRDATDAIRDYENAASGAGKGFLSGLQDAVSGAGASGQDAANEFVGGFASSSALLRMGSAAGPIGLALAGVATLGVVAGKVLANGIVEGLGTIQVQDQFQASMGLDEVSMARYANAAGQAYASNFGQSVADNLATARTALQSGLITPASSDVEVQGVIEQVQGVASVTGASAEELSRSVTQLMRTGFAGSVSDAMDIITAGFQDGLDVSQDWLDSINEYSTQFRKLGLDAGEWMTLLKQGLEGGARDTDKVADSLKEFSIRAVDGSKSTAEGFKALGFNADEMGRRFAEGGDSAKTAFGAVLEALRGIQDPQQQALIWARLFGTQFEDMGDAINRLSLDPVKNQFTDLQGTSDRATKTATDNFKSEWEEATRTVGQFFSDLKTDIAEWFSDIPVIRDLPGMIKWAFEGRNDYKGPPIPTAPPVYGPPNPLPVAGPPAGGGLGDLLNPGGGDAGSGLPPALNGPQLAPGANDYYKKLYPQQPVNAGPPAPVPGDRTPIVPDNGSGAAAKTKPSFDPSQYSVDAIPVPGAVPGTGLPPVSMTQLPTGPGGYQVDPQKVYDAETSLMSARNSVEQARIRVLELEAEGNATAQDLVQARNGVTMAERGYTSAQMKLAEAQQGTWKKMEGAAKSFGQGMDQIGVALDNDLGISKGLPGLAENLVKFVGSLAAAPLEAQLAAISKANPIQGGHGLMGVLGAKGVFGPQYTQSQYAQQQVSAMGPAGLQPVYGGQPYAAPGAAKPGEGARDFAHRVMMPFWKNMGLTVGDHQADAYGEHQNGALDIMVDDLAEGQKVLQQVLSDPNVYGAIFNNQTYGYGHGATPRDYSAGHTGNPTQDHQDHVHAWYKPGGSNNITAGGGSVPTVGIPSSPYATAAAPSYGPSPTSPAAPSMGMAPPLAGVPAMAGGTMAGGMPQAAPIGGNTGIAFPAMPGGGGVGIDGGGLLGTAMAAGGTALDLMAPGAGQAAQIGMKLLNRTIQYGSQAAGIGVSGLMETFLPSGSPLGNLGNSWFGKLAAGFASARPALPNTAGQQAPPNPNAHGQGGGQPGPTIGTQIDKLEYTNNEATQGSGVNDLTRNLEAQNAPTGVR